MAFGHSYKLPNNYIYLEKIIYVFDVSKKIVLGEKNSYLCLLNKTNLLIKKKTIKSAFEN